MPTYEYKCTVCENRFEVSQSFQDDALTSMEGCNTHGSGQHQLKKVFGMPGIAFRGSGFYKNDSRGGTETTSSDITPSSNDSSSSDSSSNDSSSSDSSSNDSSSSSTSAASSASSSSDTSSSNSAA